MNTNRSGFWNSGSVPLIEPEFLSSIIAAASDIALVVADDGKVLSVLVSDHTESYGNLKHWEDRSINDILTVESVAKFSDAHQRFLAGEAPKKLMELNHIDGSGNEFPIRYTLHRMTHNDMVLLLGRDLRPIAETQQQLVQAQIALEKGYEARREYDARYRVLLSKTRDAMAFVSVSDGKVRDANTAAAALLMQPKDTLVGGNFASVFKDRRSPELVESLLNAAMAEETSSVALQSKNGGAEVRISPSVFRAAGERILICRMDKEGEAAQDTTAVAVPGIAKLFKVATDAMLFTDPKGVIQTANDSFLEIVDSAHVSDVKGRALSEFLSRGAVDLGVLIENARRGGRMRLYATKMVSDFGGSTPIEVSATYLEDVNFPSIGFVIRDSSRLDAVGAQATVLSSEDQNRSVMELVGSASLKEIVAETTDVVEKMCIETAVSLTRNNRVAAAEMLGLSRQSLYVKLRKYGLLAKD